MAKFLVLLSIKGGVCINICITHYTNWLQNFRSLRIKTVILLQSKRVCVDNLVETALQPALSQDGQWGRMASDWSSAALRSSGSVSLLQERVCFKVPLRVWDWGWLTSETWALTSLNSCQHPRFRQRKQIRHDWWNRFPREYGLNYPGTAVFDPFPDFSMSCFAM